MGLMEKFADPEVMQSMSMGDKMVGSGITALMGMGITFIVLVLLWACIAIMTKFTYRPSSGGKTTGGTDAAPPAGGQGAAAVTTAADDSLIAVITAAITACQSGSSNFVVRKIRRLSGETTAWGDAGRADCIESRKF